MTPEIHIDLPVGAEGFRDSGLIAPFLQRLDERMFYHTFENEPSKHVWRFVNSVREIGEAMNLPPRLRQIMAIAGYGHDLGYPDGPHGHEERSAQITAIAMDEMGFDPKDIRHVEQLILATKVTWVNGIMVTKPGSVGEAIMCDADLCLLGAKTDEFFQGNDMLRRELSVDNRKQWLENQVKFMVNHRYHTRAAQELYGPQELVNTQAVIDLLKTL